MYWNNDFIYEAASKLEERINKELKFVQFFLEKTGQIIAFRKNWKSYKPLYNNQFDQLKPDIQGFHL
ncbi:hypothetical protein [Salegentibacter flavus]|uniref:Uncharacterized protein n=1 Tax=Salegentibacter flavus TaxID=287099 RepID=A0A1I4XFZ6_9FLAO|nr:hypothetical protein [Salegentibacter flavus]SFN24841.1 hypothetical protein SAMN05660413_00018 [Salegentibacter flavus]